MKEKSKDIHTHTHPHTRRTRGPQETMQAAGELLKDLWPHRGNGALVLALSGPLGSGKTQFAKGAAHFLGIARMVASPTFILMKRYDIPRTGPLTEARALYHFDYYRVHEAKEVTALGWDKIVADKHNIVLVEWPEKIEHLLPPTTVHIAFVSCNEDERELTVYPEIGCMHKR